MHKLARTQRQGFHPRDLLQPCLEIGIPVLVIVPESDQALARQLLGPLSDQITFVDPEWVYDSIAQVLELS